MAAAPSSVRFPAVAAVADRLLSLRRDHPLRVAVDGRTASGKTTFADELARVIARSGRSIIRASVDGFHRPAAVRHRQGRLSAAGYYEDARDFDAVRQRLLQPLGPGGDRRYVTQTFDLERDQSSEAGVQRAAEDAVLIVDGTFLQRPELQSAWDFVIFLRVSEVEALRRGVERDRVHLGGEERAAELYRQRYGPAFRRYEAECEPESRADLVVDNPRILP